MLSPRRHRTKRRRGINRLLCQSGFSPGEAFCQFLNAGTPLCYTLILPHSCRLPTPWRDVGWASVCEWGGKVPKSSRASIFHADRWERKEGWSLSVCLLVFMLSRKWASASLPLCCCCSMFYSDVAAVVSPKAGIRNGGRGSMISGEVQNLRQIYGKSFLPGSV